MRSRHEKYGHKDLLTLRRENNYDGFKDWPCMANKQC